MGRVSISSKYVCNLENSININLSTQFFHDILLIFFLVSFILLKREKPLRLTAEGLRICICDAYVYYISKHDEVIQGCQSSKNKRQVQRKSRFMHPSHKQFGEGGPEVNIQIQT